MVSPVALPPGRLKLSTSPSLTGSPPTPNTIGMVDVARLAARGEGSPPTATSTLTPRRTSSAASAGRGTVLTARPPVFDQQILALNVAAFGQTAAERC